MPFDIIELTETHAPDVSRLHMRCLNTPFKGKTGEQFLQMYYSTLCLKQGGTGYVAMTNDQIAGYVCGIWDQTHLQKLLIKYHWKPLLLTSFQALSTSPSIYKGLFQRLTELIRNKKSKSLQGYELRPIVVAEEFRGSEVGPLLVTTLLKDAKKRGFSSIFLRTEQDNIAANRFYQKQGFVGERSSDKVNQKYIFYSHKV